jgi:hypothetical protein
VLCALLPVGRTPDLLPGLIGCFVEELSGVLAADADRLRSLLLPSGD